VVSRVASELDLFSQINFIQKLRNIFFQKEKLPSFVS
jgi:hypothetical protein